MEFELDRLSCLNPYPVRLPGPGLLHQLVAPASDSVAIDFSCRHRITSYSYRQLHDASDILAARLSLVRGQTQGHFIVPVLVRQAPQLYISLLAILKAGGAFCPLNPDDPSARISFVIKDVSARALIVSRELAHLIPYHEGVQALQADSQDDYQNLQHVQNRIPDPRDLAYVMYTSGSTGIPKGVGISHLAASQTLLAHDRHIPSFTRFLQFAAPTFDISVFEIFFTLFRGCALIGADRNDLLNDLPALLREMKVDACELTPTVAASLLRSRDRAPNLKLLMTIGEMLNESVVREFGGDDDRESLLWAMYGPTEATIHCTLQARFPSRSSTHNIGIPLDTVSCFVIEPADAPDQSSIFKILPRGEVGELAVGGHQLAEGYLDRPDQTLTSFISSPYGRVYRTGDRARMNVDGSLECLGRLSEGQVKLNGQRLELGEVEAALLRTPGCHGATAAVLDAVLVAFCAVDAGVTEANLVAYCKRWLPPYMTPGVLVLLGELPRLPSGKVDKKKLRSDFQASKSIDPLNDDLTSEGLSETEEKILKAISQELDLEVTKRTILASVGVDSLKAISLASAIRSAGFEMSAAQLLASRTASDLCSSVRPKEETRIDTDGMSMANDVDRIVLENPALGRARHVVEDVLPCVALQTAMLAETARHTEAYWNDIELEVEPGITIEELSSAILELTRQNEILRSGFAQFDNEYATVIFKTFDKRVIEVVDSFHGLDASNPDSLLHPLRIQILDRGSEGGSLKILIHIHHAIYDGWSMDIALSDLSRLLGGAGLQPRQQFRRFIQFSKNTPLKQSDRDREFWCDYLGHWLKQPFPKLCNRPNILNDILTSEETLNISAATVDRATKQTGCSVQVYFQAALAIVWGGMLGASDVVLGSVSSGRAIPLDGVEGMMGPCIASMPLRIDLAKAQTAEDVLKSIQSSNRRIMQHSTLPLLEIRKAIGGQNNESLYDVLFVYQQSLYTKKRKQHRIKEVRHLDRLETKLLVEAEPVGDDGFRLQATYHSNIIPPQVAFHLLQQVKEVFAHLIGHETASIDSIRDMLRVPRSVDNDVPQSSNSDSDLATLFEAAAAKSPHADAICFNTSISTSSLTTSNTMSFETLNKLSNQVANFLLAQGAEPGNVVAIVMEKSTLLYASILGITKARCAYLPIHPSTPLSRLQEIFSAGLIERCLVDKAALHRFRHMQDVKLLDVDLCHLNTFSDQNLAIQVKINLNRQRLAYVIYTSGTTGVPKGVAVTQSNIVANIVHLGSTYPAAKRNPPRLLQACSQAFDVSVFEIFFAWHMGMCLCAAPNDVLFEDIEQTIRQFQITHLSLTPSVASLIEPTNVPSVEFLVTAGEPMTASVLGKWGELLWQGYGPSETTNICSVKRMKHGEHIEHLGWVFPNTLVAVLLSGGLETLPLGWVGEFCFGGDQVAAGYLNMPELTAEKFIHHPQLGRLYRSGDMGRMLPDGSLVILGRIDDQIKLRGQRIEAKEVNSTITGTLMAVETVTMMVSQQSTSSDQLASFYVRETLQGAAFRVLDIDLETHQSLFAKLMSQLPSYMVPSFLIPVSRIPLTTNGKVDQQSLQSCFSSLSREYLEIASRTTSIQDDEEWTVAEKSIAEVLSKSLDIPKLEIGRWTPFAKLGLHSISAIGVARDLKSRFQARVPISAILQNPTVAQLGRFINTTLTSTKSQSRQTQYFSLSFIEQVRKEFMNAEQEVIEVLPCFPLQEAMLSRGRDAYYNKITLQLHIEPDLIRQCWNEMVKRHNILRTCFVTTSDSRYSIAQVVLKSFVPQWQVYSIETLELDGAIRDHTMTLSVPLETKRPPFSLAIIQNPRATFLSIVCHHALYDGIAMDNLAREVENMALGNTLSSPVPPSPFLHEILSLPDDTEQFWTSQFWGFSPSLIFAGSSRGQIVQCLQSNPLDLAYDEVQHRARSLGTSLLCLCQAAWAQVLSICFESSDVCFGCVMSGRTLDVDGLDRLVAPCFNTIPLRKDISHSSHNVELAKSFQFLTSDLMPFQFTPLRTIQKKSSVHGERLFDSLLLVQLPVQEMDQRIWTLEEDSGEMDIPLVCEVTPCLHSNTVMINIHYHENVLDEDTAAALLSAFKLFLHMILDSPDSALAGKSALPSSILPLLSQLASRQRTEVRSQVSASSDDKKWSEYESAIRRVLSDLSGIPLRQIRRDTSIYKLGLDSINAVQVASMLRRQGFAVSATDVIEHQNCKNLAEKLLEPSLPKMSRLPYDFETFSTRIRPQIGDKLPRDSGLEAILPCTPIQCAMLSSFTQSKGEHYLNMVSYAIEGDVPRDTLIAGWKTLRSCHPMLRTGFAPIRHNDSSFAMIRYCNIPETSITYIHEQIQELGPTTNMPLWKRDMASSMLGSLHLPPWRLAISTTSTGLEMHLLIHHALYDAQSLDSMFAGLSDLLGGKTLTVFPPVEAALNSIFSLSLEMQEESQKFWKEKAESVVVNSFPIMTPLRENRRTILCHDIVSSLSFSVLHDATQKQGVSLQAIIQAAWTRVLSSYLGEESVVFGVTLSGRTTDETREAPFPCMVTVPIVTTNQPMNKELVDSMVKYNQDLHRHQFVPLGQVQKWLGHPATPVFDTLLVYQKKEKDPTTDRPWRRLHDDASVDYPVSVEVEPVDGNAIRLGITFFSDVLPVEQAQLLLRQFDAIMRHIAIHPNGQEDEVYSACPEIFAVTPPAMDVIPAPVELLHQFVESRALSHPNDPALEFVSGFDGEVSRKQTWTYAEFDALGNRVANMLQSKAPVGSIIAIHFEKCPEAYISILGILKAGCSFVALDVSAPRSRKEFIIGDSQAPCLLISSQMRIDFEVNCQILPIGLQEMMGYSPEWRDPGAAFSPGATCYCLYTSGTTGTPKGCEITHENCVQAMMAFQDLFKGHWQRDSRWLQFAALHFDVSVLEQYWSWSVGITVVAAPRDLILDDLIASINRLKITHIDLTPSLARLTHPDEVPGLCKGVFITGGESLKQEILDAWGPKAVIYNAYGPTEATIGVTMYQRVPVNGRPSNIGKQFLNVGSFVFRNGTEIPVLRGAVGELCISGKLVGKGYLNRPELTNERFPMLSGFGGERIYRTGDLVRILHDGCFEFLGRADDQVKLRGQRLEIGEINHVIRTGAPEVKDVATLVVRHRSGGKDILVSFLVGQHAIKGAALAVLLQGQEKLGASAREACRAKLPSYMVPSYFLVLPFIPLSPNNKVEAKELKRLFNGLSPEELVSLMAIPPSSTRRANTEIMRKTTKILAEFCHLDKDSIRESTSIFDLGIDSITALRLSTQFKNHGLKTCSPAILLRNPIVADLSAELSKHQDFISTASLVQEAKQTIQASHHRYLALICRVLAVQPHDVEYVAPCSALQQGIISKAATSEVLGTYFNSFELTLDETISVERLKFAWADLVRTQAILRTCFVKTADGYVQTALKDGTLLYWQEHRVEDDAGLIIAARAARQEWIERNQDEFKLPFQVVLVKGPGIKKKLLIQIFHALYDWISFDRMMKQIQMTYHRDRSRTSSSGPSFLEALCHGPLWRYDESREFWAAHLQHWEPSLMPRISTSTGSNAVQSIRVMSGSALEAVRQRQNVTLQSVVMALWTAVLQQYFSFANGVSVGVIVAGRSMDLLNVENTIGPLFNTVPFFNKSLQGQSWASLIRKCHEFHTSILSFQHVSLKSVQKWCSGGRPLFDNVFVFGVEQKYPDDGPDLWTVEDGPAIPDYPLSLEAKQLMGGDIQLCLVAQGQVADVANLEDILEHVEKGIASMAADQTLQLNDLPNSNMPQQQVDLRPDDAEVNGPEGDRNSFVWTDQALEIRHTVASLVDVSAEDITSTTTTLELGLDSVDIIQLSAKLRSRDINLSASVIMRHQTISQMSHQVQMLAREYPAIIPLESTADSSFDELTRRLWNYTEGKGVVDMARVEAVLPPTHLQESMVAGMVHSDFAWYFNHDLLEVSAGTDIQRLRDAWIQVVKSSPILRTGFLEIEDRQLDIGYCQIVYKDSTLNIEELQVSSLSEVDHLIQRATAHAREHRGLDNLFQIKSIACQERRFFLVSMAHALYDGWSLDLIYRDLEAAVYGKMKGRISSQPFLRKLLVSQTRDDAHFWTNYLDGAMPAMIPEKVGTTSPGDGVHRREKVAIKSMSEISGFCKKRSISLQTLLQACWAAVLAHRARSLDVTFGIVLSGRDFTGAEDLLFPTINTVPLRCILHGNSPEFLGYLEAMMMDIRDHQTYPLRKIQTPSRVPSADLFNTLCILQKTAINETSSQSLLKSVEGSSAVDYPVCVEAEATKDGLVWRVACQARFQTEEETQQLVRDLDSVLAFMIRPEPTTVLSFRDDRVSICGLSHVSLVDEVDEGSKSPFKEDTTVDRQPLSDMGLTIRRILSLVAGLSEELIPAQCSLYHLGLDSISALKVCSLLRKKGILMNPRDLLKATSIAQMVHAASQQSETSRSVQKTPDFTSKSWQVPENIDIKSLLADAHITEQDVDLILPALPMQVYMITAWQRSQGSVFFPEFQYVINGVKDGVIVDAERVNLAWQSLVAELPILRTCFLATRSGELPFLQLAMKPSSPISADGIVMPFVAFRASADEKESVAVTVRLRIHHALYDGVSLPAIMKQLLDKIHSQGRQKDVETLDGDTRSWSRFAIQRLEEGSRESRKDFWTKYLCDVFPTSDQSKDTIITAAAGGSRVSYLKKAAMTDIAPLRLLTFRHGVSIQSLFLAAYAKALVARRHESNETSSYEGQIGGNANGQVTVVFGIYLANRALEEAEGPPSTFPTLNLVPLKVTAAQGVSIVDIARAIQHDLQGVSSGSRAHVGLWEVAQWTGVTISSFVNFLSFVEEEDEEEEDAEKAESRVVDNHSSIQGVFKEPRDLNENTSEGREPAALHQQISDNMVKEYFPAAVDIEVSIQNDALDIGVFGSTERISSEREAATLVEDIVGYLAGM